VFAALGAIRSPGAIALIGGAAGVIGGVLGALAGGFATYRLEEQRQRFERRRDERAEEREDSRQSEITRGVARVWATRFDDFRHLVESYGRPDDDGALYWIDEYDDVFIWDTNDMRRIAAVASAQQWQTIDHGLSNVRAVVSARALSGGGAEYDDDDRKVVRQALRKTEDAAEVLQLANEQP
jgi:hypothetical protein